MKQLKIQDDNFKDKSLVYGEGNYPNRVMFIGDMVSAEDQERNRNFINELDGKILTYSFKAAKINRSDVYLTHIVKTHLPRKPKISDIKQYLPILVKEIEIVDPELIVLLGTDATIPFFRTKTIQDKRGFVHNHSSKLFGDRKIIVTYNPRAFLSSNPLWEVMVSDLKRAKRVLDGTYNPSKTKMVVLDNLQDITSFLQNLEEEKIPFAWDLETDGVLFWNTRGIACYSFSKEEGTSYVIPLVDGGKPLYKDKISKLIQDNIFDFLLNGPNFLITQNGQFDYNFLMGVRGFDRPHDFYKKWCADSYLMHCILEEDRPHTIEYQASLHTDLSPWDRELKKHRAGKKDISYYDVPGNILWPYAAGDTDATLRLFNSYYPRLIEEDLEDYYFFQWQEIAKVIAEIAYRGIPIDLNAMDALLTKYEMKRDDLVKTVYEIVGEKFNLKSYVQKGKILYEKLQLPEVSPRTEGGHYATDKDTLEILAKLDVHPVAKPLHEFATINRYLTGYLGNKPQSLRSNTGPDKRCRASWLAQETGRYGASSPNLTNIPRKGGFREIFKALPGWDLIEADYSQAELRYFAYDSGEQSVIDAFESGFDGHTATAAAIYGVSLEEVTPEMRSVGKTVNFLMQYGGGAKKLSKEAGVSVVKAKQILKKFYDTHKNFKARIDELHAQAFNPDIRKVVNAYGRVRHAPIALTQRAKSAFGREIVNSISQGGVADTVWRAMIKINNFFKEKGLKAHFVLVLHDGVYVMCPKYETSLVVSIMKKFMMEPIPKLGCILPVDFSVSDKWEGK